MIFIVYTIQPNALTVFNSSDRRFSLTWSTSKGPSRQQRLTPRRSLKQFERNITARESEKLRCTPWTSNSHFAHFFAEKLFAEISPNHLGFRTNTGAARSEDSRRLRCTPGCEERDRQAATAFARDGRSRAEADAQRC